MNERAKVQMELQVDERSSITHIHFGRDQCYMQVCASFSPFGHQPVTDTS